MSTCTTCGGRGTVLADGRSVSCPACGGTGAVFPHAQLALAEIEQAGRARVRGWHLTQRQRERLWVLLRPYTDQLLPASPTQGDAA